jgi:hypothetical protein
MTREAESFALDAGLLDDPMNKPMTPDDCDLDHWFRVAGPTYADLHRGHRRESEIPSHMLEPGPLREAMLMEFAFRARTEEAAVRGISLMVHCAPDLSAMDFYATQLLDEARHAYVFRWHLIELGLSQSAIGTEIDRLVGDYAASTIAPVERLFLDHGQRGDFMACVLILSVIAEGALAPAAEMSERKWRVFDPPAAEIARGANLDEIRHLAVGSSIVRTHLENHPEARPHLLEVMAMGSRVWADIPIQDVLMRRETTFQKGLEQNPGLAGAYELVPGRPLADTTAEERLEIQLAWSARMRDQRLKFMGLF